LFLAGTHQYVSRALVGKGMLEGISDIIALAHEKLHQSGALAQVELGDYLRALAQQLTQAWAPSPAPRVDLKVEADDIVLALEGAVACGLVINELNGLGLNGSSSMRLTFGRAVFQATPSSS